jgi:hypothetical protein
MKLQDLQYKVKKIEASNISLPPLNKATLLSAHRPGTG